MPYFENLYVKIFICMHPSLKYSCVPFFCSERFFDHLKKKQLKSQFWTPSGNSGIKSHHTFERRAAKALIMIYESYGWR